MLLNIKTWTKLIKQYLLQLPNLFNRPYEALDFVNIVINNNKLFKKKKKNLNQTNIKNIQL